MEVGFVREVGNGFTALGERRTFAQTRDAIVEHLVKAARMGMWLCLAGCVACAVGIVLQVGTIISSFPADIVEVFTWEASGYGFLDATGMSWVESRLVEDKYVDDPVSGSYLLFEIDGDMPLAKEVATVVSFAFGVAVLAVGARFFRQVAMSGRPFERTRARELLVLAALVVAAAIVPNIVGLAISTWAYNTYAITHGRFTWGVWEPGVVDGLLVVLGVFVLMMARVFRYGCELQEQDDRLL